MALLRQHAKLKLVQHSKEGSPFEEEIMALNPSLSVLEKFSEIIAQPEVKIELCRVGSGNTKKRRAEHDVPFHRQRQRRKGCISWEINTSFPDHDGYQWRKYGEKKITNNQFTRCYYRCTYYREHNCKATKYVQQRDYSDPPMYNVTYFNDHVCASGSISNSNSNSQSTNTQQILDFSAKTSPVSCHTLQADGIKEEKIEESLATSISTVKRSSNSTEVHQSTGQAGCLSDGSTETGHTKIEISDKECTSLDLYSDQWFDLCEFDTMFSGLEDMEFLGSLFETSDIPNSLKSPSDCFLLD